jgi:hypothetical protein
MVTKKMTKREKKDLTININAMGDLAKADEIQERLLELQLRMATCSMNHEYARIEYEDTSDYERREELLRFMHDCHCQYLDARQALEVHDPLALESFEADLMMQKQTVMSQYYI